MCMENKEIVEAENYSALKCPVCNGKGVVNYNFYDIVNFESTAKDFSPISCRTCFGAGIIKVGSHCSVSESLSRIRRDYNLHSYVGLCGTDQWCGYFGHKWWNYKNRKSSTG